MPVTLIGESVFARCLSSLKSERVEASKVLKGPATAKYSGDKKEFIDHIKKVRYLSCHYKSNVCLRSVRSQTILSTDLLSLVMADKFKPLHKR